MAAPPPLDPDAKQPRELRKTAFDLALTLSAVVAADPDFSPTQGYSAYTLQNAKKIEHYLKTGGITAPDGTYSLPAD